ncbi:MAG: 3-deoxy-manno-octulosonate cytidylyltransferase [Puniceicoccales bacterium]|jgi:3-deoxy-manno-octulosonate cytidylyltransferase (CMP-KDO synthetase)|nr:3-deoxy-manno-octulosonate cytidylyltransferase [Puniceicoccales bacterium]
MKSSLVVPARLASSRFPKKILKELGGIPLLRRVLERVAKVPNVAEVVALVDEESVLERVNSWGFDAILTSRDCNSGTERILSVKDKLLGDFIINVQGDEPFISLKLLEKMVNAAARDEVSLSEALLTAIYPIKSAESLWDPNRVKVVMDRNDRAIYFSRHPIPFLRNISRKEEWPNFHQFWGHIGIYGYRKETLQLYSTLADRFLENAESLEQLRFIENGIPVHLIRDEEPVISIDTAEDLLRAETFLQTHPDF